MNQIEIDALEAEHARLLRASYMAVAAPHKRINYRLCEIENTLMHATKQDKSRGGVG